jgi:hypothetical protein
MLLFCNYTLNLDSKVFNTQAQSLFRTQVNGFRFLSHTNSGRGPGGNYITGIKREELAEIMD